MIAHLRGKLISKHPNQAIVEAAGVGYDVTITVPTFSDLPALGSEVALHVHTHVREDAIALFGFLRADEKQLFEKLITVSGIGPKLAITILSGMPTAEMVGAIRGNDFARLTRIPGIGKKTAERMCVELRDKLDAFGAPQAAAPVSAIEEDVISALTNLGYQRAVAEKCVERAVASAGHENFDAIFRAALGAIVEVEDHFQSTDCQSTVPSRVHLIFVGYFVQSCSLKALLMSVRGSVLSSDLGSGRAQPQTVQLHPVSHEVFDQNSLRGRSAMAALLTKSQ